jgi:DNA-binding CsgD family transcriptional regulator
MIGRDQEQTRLRELLEHAQGGSGGALVVLGEPGVGKSVLLSFAAKQAIDMGFVVLESPSRESESELPFAGLHTLLAPVSHELQRLEPRSATMLRGALGFAPAQTDDLLTIYLAVFNLISAIGLEKTVLVLTDDLHWMDGASRDAILFVARRAPRARVVVLACARSEYVGLFQDASVDLLQLAGLPEEAGIRLARQARPDLADSAGRNLWRATDGNPLALIEIAPLLTDQQARGHALLDEPLPTGPRLQHVFTRRFSEMPPDTQRALLLAAASHTASTRVVREAGAAFGSDDAELEPAEIGGLITINEGTIFWRHPLLRAAIYNGASGPERRAAHRALAEAGGEERLEDHRAWHLAAASAEADEQVAVELELLAKRARTRGAPSTVLRALARAAALSPDREQRSRRLIAAAEAATMSGSWSQAESMIAEAQQLTDSPLLRAQATRVLARVEIVRGVPDAAHARLVAAAESITELDLPAAAMMMTEAVVAHMATGDWAAYQRTAERAVELGRHLQGPAEAAAGVALAALYLANGRTGAALDLLERYEAVVWDPTLWHQAPEIIGMYAFCDVWLERLDVAQRLLDQSIASVRQAGSLRALPYPLAVSANLNFRRGRWSLAYEQALEATELSRELLTGAVLANALGFLVQIEAASGRSAAAKAHGAEALKLCHELSLGAVAFHTLQGLAVLDMSEGRYDSALRNIARIDPRVEQGCNEPGLSLWRGYGIEAHIRVGQTEAASKLLGELEHWSSLTARSVGHAQAARCRGLLASDAEFEAHFESALHWHRAADLPFEGAVTQLCYGERLRRAHHRAAARTQLTAAADTFRTLGAQLWLTRAETELSAAGARPRPAVPSSGWDQLTHQERRVAELIIDGATYREAAEGLFLSPRTIEAHLRQIYRKLRVRSRTELTRKLASAGQDSGPGERRSQTLRHSGVQEPSS